MSAELFSALKLEGRRESKVRIACKQTLLQLRVLDFRSHEDGNIGIGVFPQC
jgi:hypothetical protein